MIKTHQDYLSALEELNRQNDEVKYDDNYDTIYTEVVCYQGYSYKLSQKAICALNALGHKEPEKLSRHHKDLVEVVKTLGVNANGDCCDLFIEKVRGFCYKITKDEYHGKESSYSSEEEFDSYPWIKV